MNRALRGAGYGAFFLACFVVASVLTFPVARLKPLLIDQAEKALGKGKQGKDGVDPVVTIGDLTMSGLGIKAKRVQVQLANSEPEPGPTFDFDSLRVSASLLSAFTASKTVQLDADLYQGSANAAVTVDDKGNVEGVVVGIDDVELGRVTAIMAALGAPVAGKVSADIDVVMGKAADKEAKGNIDIKIAGLVIGPGNLRAVPGGFEMETGIALGDLKLTAPVDKGQGAIVAKLDGTPDIEAEADGTITLRNRLQQSRLDVDGFFRPTAPFLDKNGKIKSLLELGEKFTMPGAPSLSKAKDSDGRYHFQAKGIVQSLKPQLSRDGGRRTKSKSAATPDAAGATDGKD